MKKHQHPQCQWVCVNFLCLLGDLLATIKVGGFASPTTTSCCTWCLAQYQCLQNLELGVTHKWYKTISAAKNSKSTASANAQDTILKNTSVWWSKLNRLCYWEPSQEIALGIMHNWLEGILQSHWQYRWLLIATVPKKLKSKVKEFSNYLEISGNGIQQIHQQ